MRKFLRYIERMLAIGFRDARSFMKQVQNGLPCLIELIGIIGSRVFRNRRKRNHGN
jgi:hypothetical protein